MKMEDKIKMAEKNIWQALDDYRAHTYSTAVVDGVSEAFVHKLARDNTYFKRELRDLFRKSPVWNEELDALVINGTRTHNPNYERVANLAEEILAPVRMQMTVTQNTLLDGALRFLCFPDEDPQMAIDAMNKLVPKAFAVNKKPSRIFHSLCEGMGMAAVNLSSGYYSAHSLHESINLRHLEKTISRVTKMVEEAACDDFPRYEYIESIWNDGWRYGGLYDADIPKSLPKEYRHQYSILLDYYTKQDLENYRKVYGDGVLQTLYEDIYGYYLEE